MKSPKQDKRPRYKTIGPVESDDDSIYKLSTSQKAVLKDYARQKTLALVHHRSSLLNQHKDANQGQYQQ